MLFNSVEFLFLFLPVTFVGYFLLLRLQVPVFAKLWLLGASLYFYSYWHVNYLPLLLSSLMFNFFAGRLLSGARLPQGVRRVFLLLAVGANIAFLGYYKYADFLIENINLAFDAEVAPLNLLLPLAISFFTFQQIAYLVDSYRGEVEERNPIDYAIFISFFPQLIAGPIVHHKEMMPQFAGARHSRINLSNIYVGLFLIGIGLFKKTVIADQFAPWVDYGYSDTEGLSLIGSWALSLGFTMQLVFDFTAYSDMAIGIGLLFNIRLPINFYSSLKATSIAEFWDRWHLTLTSFLRQYVYFPLGGNRKGFARANVNLFIVFMIAGIWHGSGWNFVMWGVLQGGANVLYRIWKKHGMSMHPLLGWFLTFNFINVICVYFRAPTFADSANVLMGMAGLNGIVPDGSPSALAPLLPLGFLLSEISAGWKYLLWLGVAFYLALFTRNSMEIGRDVTVNIKSAFYSGLLIGVSLLTLLDRKDEFIYFDF